MLPILFLGILVALTVGAIVGVVPHLGTAGAVGVIAGCVVLIACATWIIRNGGGSGGWHNSGRMGK